MIIPVYQRLGTSTHRLAQKTGEFYRAKATHSGTLDPMAEGVVVVLTDEDRFKKEKFASWQKTYEFQVLWEVSTDTQDLLGVVTESLQKTISVEDMDTEIKNILLDFLGTQTQLIPAFSAKRINGQSYFDVAKEKSQQTKLTHTQEIKIYSIEQVETTTIKAQEILEQLNRALSQIINDFRQEEIKKKWSEWINSLPQQENTLLPSSTFTATTSKRTYIRGLVRDMSEKLGIPATTFHIIRTANGPYQIQDCVCLV